MNSSTKYYPMVKLDGEWRFVHAIYATTVATTKAIYEAVNTTSKDICSNLIELIKNQYQYKYVKIIEMTTLIRDVDEVVDE